MNAWVAPPPSFTETLQRLRSNLNVAEQAVLQLPARGNKRRRLIQSIGTAMDAIDRAIEIAKEAS